MNKTIVAAVSLFAGGIAGFFVGRRACERKYQLLADAEIASVKRAFRRDKQRSASEGSARVEGENLRDAASGLAVRLGYAKEADAPESGASRVISPEEFASLPEYEEVSLTYYSDGVVADENDHALSPDEVERSIGADSLAHFGEYEEDSVFVRNDAYKTDYEILYDQRTYAQVLEEKPYLAS